LLRESPRPTAATPYLRVSFIDVGQGDAIQGRSGANGTSGRTILIDGGPGCRKKTRGLKYIETHALSPGALIDCVATHPYDDYYPGLEDVLEHYQVGMIIDSGFPKEGVERATLVATVRKETVERKKSIRLPQSENVMERRISATLPAVASYEACGSEVRAAPLRRSIAKRLWRVPPSSGGTSRWP